MNQTVRVRPVAGADVPAILRVAERNGIALDLETWRSQWEKHPYAADFEGIPTGWVLETDDGAIVGNLDNVHILYRFQGRRLRGVVAANWAVDLKHRGNALQLMTTFFRQKGVDLYLNVTATPTTSHFLTAMRVARIPIPGYDRPCFWAARPRGFAHAALRRKSIPGAAILAWPAGCALWVRDALGRSGRGSVSRSVRRLEKFDARFDELWCRIESSGRLRAFRTRAALEWRFRSELRSGGIAIVAAERDSVLEGYSVLTRRDPAELQMELYEIADLQAAGDDPAVVRDLLIGSVRVAKDAGADAVKFSTGSPANHAVVETLRPYSYQLSFWQQYFRTSTPALAEQLSAAEAWDFSRFDQF